MKPVGLHQLITQDALETPSDRRSMITSAGWNFDAAVSESRTEGSVQGFCPRAQSKGLVQGISSRF